MIPWSTFSSLQWRHNGRDGVSNHQPYLCLLVYWGADQRKHQSSVSLAFGSLCGEFNDDRWIHTQRASDAENVSIWWRHRVALHATIIHGLSQSCYNDYTCQKQESYSISVGYSTFCILSDLEMFVTFGTPSTNNVCFLGRNISCMCLFVVFIINTVIGPKICVSGSSTFAPLFDSSFYLI